MSRPPAWKVVRIPSALADRIAALADRMMLAHAEGRYPLPAEFVEHVPPHHVIDRAVAEMEARRERSRRHRRVANHGRPSGRVGWPRSILTRACNTIGEGQEMVHAEA